MLDPLIIRGHGGSMLSLAGFSFASRNGAIWTRAEKKSSLDRSSLEQPSEYPNLEHRLPSVFISWCLIPIHLLKKIFIGSSCCGQWVKNPTAVAQLLVEVWVQSPAQHSGLKGCSIAAVTWIQSMAVKFPYAVCGAISIFLIIGHLLYAPKK